MRLSGSHFRLVVALGECQSGLGAASVFVLF